MFWRSRFEKLAVQLRIHDIPARIALWDGSRFDLGESVKVVIRVLSQEGLRRMVQPSLDSLGSAYIEGLLDVEGKLEDIFDVAARLARHAVRPVGRFGRVVRSARHTRKTDADAIAYHYDVSNDFYRLWLDENMVYSCAYFKKREDALEQAQLQKLDHVLRKIRVQPGQRLLDIGCGWGALILRAVQKFGASATGITLSRTQYELTQERIDAAGVSDRCEVLLADYHDVDGQFERITSIGMLEHVGLKHLRAYFAKVRELLTGDGIALIHSITSTDPESGSVAWGGGSFINRYVFPHGELPHVALMLKEMSAAGLETFDVENLRRHYALTLGHWTRRYEQATEKIRAMIDERRYRIWRVYLAGCAYAFEHGWTSVYQILAARADHPETDRTPLTRDFMYGEAA